MRGELRPTFCGMPWWVWVCGANSEPYDMRCCKFLENNARRGPSIGCVACDRSLKAALESSQWIREVEPCASYPLLCVQPSPGSRCSNPLMSRRRRLLCYRLFLPLPPQLGVRVHRKGREPATLREGIVVVLAVEDSDVVSIVDDNLGMTSLIRRIGERTSTIRTLDMLHFLSPLYRRPLLLRFFRWISSRHGKVCPRGSTSNKDSTLISKNVKRRHLEAKVPWEGRHAK
ncbi:hypothetical protein FPV67DRAFT_493492 [Lyophyllum atratum]|nr:hypothetical protein FPV67DRAFT_493492 [Lyophyllum atratum]